ncbi:hypothetical protein AAGF08_00545 [Algoriphagus sp. SE2]|uniref:hypothetical protein n=1 Tax=Algoriphagus sp. SE2 TaxID=3141536 RepID=UPI0031CCE6D2
MKITLKGIPVSKVYYSGQEPQITNGCFQLTNANEKPISFHILKVEVSDGEKNQTITKFHLYKLPEYDELAQKSIPVGSKADLNFDLSFPFISQKGFNRDNIQINLTIKVNDEIIQSSSQVFFELRRPKN